MPSSKSLVSSWTASIIPSLLSSSSSSSSSGTHSHSHHHASPPRNAHPEKKIPASPPSLSSSRSHTCRVGVLKKYLHGFWWKAVSFPRKEHDAQLASEPEPEPTMLRQVSSTIIIQDGAMLASRLSPPTPTPLGPPPPIIFSPSYPTPTTPTTPACIPGGVDTNPNSRPTIATVDAKAGSKFSQPFERLSPVVLVAGPSVVVVPQVTPLSRIQPGSSSSPVPDHPHSPPLSSSSASPRLASTTISRAPLPPGAPTSILDAATRLQDFRALIAEMRVALLHCNMELLEGFNAESREDDNDDDRDNDDYDDDNEYDDIGEYGERERVLRLLEDVMRTVKYLVEKDAAGFSRPVTEIDAVVQRYSLGLIA